MEDEPILELELGGKELLSHRHNTSLFSFLGTQMIDGTREDISAYDHIFVSTSDEENGVMQGKYIFKTHKVFPEILSFMQNHGWPEHRNLNQVADCDIRAFNAAHYQDIEDGNIFPEAWLDEPQET